MRPELKHLRRLQRLEKLRAMAKQAAATEAAEAEGTLVQLLALSERTGLLVEDYRKRGAPDDALALRQRLRFTAGLDRIAASTRQDAILARDFADRKQADLACAERRRAAVEDRARQAERDLATGRTAPVLGARRALGTGVE
jgi:hypothetical protein